MDADFCVGKWQAFTRLNTLTRGTESVRIEPKMMEVLAFLAKHKGEVISKNEIIRQVWPDTFITDEALWRCVSELRKILGDNNKHPQFIQTIPRRGYRLIAQAENPEACPCIRLRRAGLRVPAEIIGSIAVLPFVDMTQEKDQKYLCESIAEEITNTLASVPGLSVAARTSAFHSNLQTENVRKIGEQLHVCAVLEGSVRRVGDQLRIVAQLICARDGFHVWSERYDFVRMEPFAIQDAISRAVAKKIQNCRDKTTPARKAGQSPHRRGN